MAVLLRLESSRNESHFPATGRLIEVHKDVGRPQVAVVFRNFVLQDQMAPEGIPRQVRYQTMILVAIVAVVSEDQIWRASRLQFLEVLLDVMPDVWEETVPEAFDVTLHVRHAFQEGAGAGARLSCSLL
jgi:hypothetical protein